MNSTSNLIETNEAKSFTGYCSKSFEIEDQTVVNSYKCNGKKLSTSDLWTIQKNKRQFSITTGLLSNIL
jgi:hypothetical protein